MFTREDQAERDRDLVDGSISGVAPDQVANLAKTLTMAAADLTALTQSMIVQQFAGRLHDQALSNDEIADLLRAASRPEATRRMLTDLDGTPFVIPPGTAAAVSALVRVPIAI